MAYAKPQRELALALLGAGASVSTVARQLGISRRTVHRWKESLGEHTAGAPAVSGERVAPELTLASIAVDSRMPAGARVQAAKTLIELAPPAVAADAPEEMSERERFEVSLLAALVYLDALGSGQHELSPSVVSELLEMAVDLRGRADEVIARHAAAASA